MQGILSNLSERGEFKIFPFFKLHSQNEYLTEQYEKCFRDKLKLTSVS